MQKLTLELCCTCISYNACYEPPSPFASCHELQFLGNIGICLIFSMFIV